MSGYEFSEAEKAQFKRAEDELKYRLAVRLKWAQTVKARTQPWEYTLMTNRGEPVRCRVRPKRISKKVRRKLANLKIDQLLWPTSRKMLWCESLALAQELA